MKQGLGLFYKGKEVSYKGYKKVQLDESDFTRAYKGIRKNKVKILFPVMYGSKPVLVDEVVFENIFGMKFSDKFEKEAVLYYNTQPTFPKNKLKITI